MWSKPLLCRFRQSGEILQTQVSQGFAVFRLALFRIPPRHSQTTRDTSFAIPGYSASAIIPRRGEKSKAFSRCGHLCAQLHIGQVNKKAMRDMVSCDKAELPHQLIRKRDHIPHGQENNTGHGISAIPDEEHGKLRLRVRQPVYPDYFTFRAAFSWSTRSVRSQVTPRSSRPMCP